MKDTSSQLDFFWGYTDIGIQIRYQALYILVSITKLSVEFFLTSRFHSLHHTQFRTNYALFMPIYDYIDGTEDKTSDSLYETSHEGRKEMTDVVHLTHPTTLHSIYHLRLGFASLASKPYASKWYLWIMWPVTWASMLLTWIFGSTFTVEKNKLDKLKMQTWAIPRYSFQVCMNCTLLHTDNFFAI